MFTRKSNKANEITNSQKDAMLRCQAQINCKRDYGYLSAQSVAIEYNRLKNLDFSTIRFDAACSATGTAGR